MLSHSDLKQLESKGISVNQIEEQLKFFGSGFPYLSIYASASVQKGILYIPENEQELFLRTWDVYLLKNNTIVKFVPASGAASRMFKDLFEFLDTAENTITAPSVTAFFEGISQFAFYHLLQYFCRQNEGKSIAELIASGESKKIIENLLYDKGLNYGQLPKGLIFFHSYPGSSRTAMEEHLAEGAKYACNVSKRVNLHFTVSPEHHKLFQQRVDEILSEYENRFGVWYNIEFSEQKSSTDTIAADADNQPFYDKEQLVFRPGGHGALIENLNDIQADVVFIKNIDNVVPDLLKSETVRYKKLIAGILVHYQQKIFEYLYRIDSGKYNHKQVLEMLYFIQNELCIKNPETKILEDGELILYIKSKLNRPLRVCGMVRNQGEPGGGPFLTVNADGTISLQILESSQIDLKDPEKKQLFEQGTHFNPVDLVCALKNYKGEKFDLLRHVDKNTGFISLKSKNGKELKALELPGLWNGAMSDWNTIFVEVPIETFNPVKTVNDLLRPEHNFSKAASKDF
ncbi:MAG: DUF4301 family protein [Candidatus Symbiothrix sp.]|jgi:hypothetical protein|nr:DUF4301 family protein [Candidatus Symbiothrix sp.]